jgi:hypothetical protein
MYHTQEKWKEKLSSPIKCIRDDAWFGSGYYFWYYEQDAVHWGNRSKRNTKYYEIYKSDINLDNVLDTVFNEEEYIFWVKQIEKFGKLIFKEIGEKPTLSMLNNYFFERGIWSKFDGILFQDITKNPDFSIIQEFQYKKRIQLAVYNLDIVTNFALHYEGQCV